MGEVAELALLLSQLDKEILAQADLPDGLITKLI